jgi:hypothetical protein
VPSPFEIAGVAFGLIPLVVTMSSVESETVNGQVTKFEYRDWVAIGGGAAAGVCGLVALALLARTDRAQRLVRVAIAVVLLGLAALQILRGVGMIGVDRPASREVVVTEHVAAGPPEEPMPAVDVDRPTRELFAAWAKGELQQILDAAHPEMRETVPVAKLAVVHGAFTETFGPFQKLGDKLDIGYEQSTFSITGTAIHAKDTLPFKIQYRVVDGKPLLTFLHFDLPKSFPGVPVPAEGDQLARRFLDTLLAGTVDRGLIDPAVVSKVSPELERELRGVLAKLGKVKSIAAPKERECAERCLDFAIIGTKSRALFTVDLVYQVTRWRVGAFNLDLVKR